MKIGSQGYSTNQNLFWTVFGFIILGLILLMVTGTLQYRPQPLAGELGAQCQIAIEYSLSGTPTNLKNVDYCSGDDCYCSFWGVPHPRPEPKKCHSGCFKGEETKKGANIVCPTHCRTSGVTKKECISKKGCGWYGSSCSDDLPSYARQCIKKTPPPPKSCKYCGTGTICVDGKCECRIIIACTNEYKPVCCDGKKYGNKCQALKANAENCKAGECQNECLTEVYGAECKEICSPGETKRKESCGSKEVCCQKPLEL